MRLTNFSIKKVANGFVLVPGVDLRDSTFIDWEQCVYAFPTNEALGEFLTLHAGEEAPAPQIGSL